MSIVTPSHPEPVFHPDAFDLAEQLHGKAIGTKNEIMGRLTAAKLVTEAVLGFCEGFIMVGPEGMTDALNAAEATVVTIMASTPNFPSPLELMTCVTKQLNALATEFAKEFDEDKSA